jgi:hypothetical protein
MLAAFPETSPCGCQISFSDGFLLSDWISLTKLSRVVYKTVAIYETVATYEPVAIYEPVVI